MHLAFSELSRDPIADLMTPERLAACQVVAGFLADAARLVMSREDGADVLTTCPICLLATAGRLTLLGQAAAAREVKDNAYLLIAHNMVAGAVAETERRR